MVSTADNRPKQYYPENLTGKQFGHFFGETISANEDWRVQRIIRAVLSPDNRFMYCIIRGTVVTTGNGVLYCVVAELDKKTASLTLVCSRQISLFDNLDQVRILSLIYCPEDYVYCAFYDANKDSMVAVAYCMEHNITNTNKHPNIREFVLATRQQLEKELPGRNFLPFSRYIIGLSSNGRDDYPGKVYEVRFQHNNKSMNPPLTVSLPTTTNTKTATVTVEGTETASIFEAAGDGGQGERLYVGSGGNNPNNITSRT